MDTLDEIVNAAAREIMRKGGISISRDDPEFQELLRGRDARGFLEALPEALDRKRARQAQEQQAQRARDEAEVAAFRADRAAGQQPGPDDVVQTAWAETEQALTARLVELQKNPSKNWEEIRQATAALDEAISKRPARPAAPATQISAETSNRLASINARMEQLVRHPSKNMAEIKELAAELDKYIPRAQQ